MREVDNQTPEWAARANAVDLARKAIGAGLEVGSIAIRYDSPASDTGQVWIKAECNTCEATRVMRASHPRHLGFLAMSMVQNACLENGHDQREDIVMYNGEPKDMGSEGVVNLNLLKIEAEDRLEQAQQDLETVARFRERLLGEES